MAGSGSMMKAASLVACTALLALAACASGPARQPMGDRTRAMLNANPSAVIATELAFARMARAQGTWTAFRHYSTSDALWPSPGWTNVQVSLRGTPDPAEPIVWGPDSVWISCDGSFAASTGEANLPGGQHSRFLTIWQRQSNGDYRWVLDQGFDSDSGEIAPEMIAGKVAECPEQRRRPERPRVRRGEAWQTGSSNDETLRWESVLRADCSREVTVEIAARDGMEQVFHRVAPAPPEGGACGT